MVATFYYRKQKVLRYLIFLPHTVALLRIRERKKWNRKIKRSTVLEVKIVRAGTRTILFFLPRLTESFSPYTVQKEKNDEIIRRSNICSWWLGWLRVRRSVSLFLNDYREFHLYMALFCKNYWNVSTIIIRAWIIQLSTITTIYFPQKANYIQKQNVQNKSTLHT